MLAKLRTVFRRFGLYPLTARDIMPVVFMWLGVIAVGYWSAEITQAIATPLGTWGVYLRVPGAVSFWLLCAVIYRTLMDES